MGRRKPPRRIGLNLLDNFNVVGDEVPPPPTDLFPPDWDLLEIVEPDHAPAQIVPAFMVSQETNPNPSSIPEKKPENKPVTVVDGGEPAKDYSSPISETYKGTKNEASPSISLVSQPASHYIVLPPDLHKDPDEQEVRMLTVVFRSTGDKNSRRFTLEKNPWDHHFLSWNRSLWISSIRTRPRLFARVPEFHGGDL